MRVIITGAFGFIGSNIAKRVARDYNADIIAVDNLTNSHKFKNLPSEYLCDFVSKDNLITMLHGSKQFNDVDLVIHQGACSNTLEMDGEYMMENNYEFSKKLLGWAQENMVRIIYASSASVYGLSKKFSEKPEFENPLNIYGYSKLFFDQLVRKTIQFGNSAQIIGLRYFNVYGFGESHKGRMASLPHKFFNQLNAGESLNLFDTSHGFGAGCQKRDFVYIDDIVNVVCHFLEKSETSGIFNVGSGKSTEFNELAINCLNSPCVKQQENCFLR